MLRAKKKQLETIRFKKIERGREREGERKWESEIDR